MNRIINPASSERNDTLKAMVIVGDDLVIEDISKNIERARELKPFENGIFATTKVNHTDALFITHEAIRFIETIGEVKN